MMVEISTNSSRDPLRVLPMADFHPNPFFLGLFLLNFKKKYAIKYIIITNAISQVIIVYIPIHFMHLQKVCVVDAFKGGASFFGGRQHLCKSDLRSSQICPITPFDGPMK